MAIQVTISPGSNTADVADKGIDGIPARFIARYAAKNPNSKRFELTIANNVYDVTVADPVVAKPAKVPANKVVKNPIEKKDKPKRIRPSRSKAAIAAREAAKKK